MTKMRILERWRLRGNDAAKIVVALLFCLTILRETSAASNHRRAAADRELQVKPDGDSHTRGTGVSIVFTCEVTAGLDIGKDSYNLQWFHNNNEITDKTTSRMYVEDEPPNVRKLYITRIENSDKGKYRCTGLINGDKQEKVFELNLFKDITFDHAPLEQHPAIHTDTLIECRVSGQPPPEISWRHKSERIQTGVKYKIEANGLRITNVTQDDDGNYTCRAEVEADGRYDERKISLEVHIPPVISEGPGKLDAIEGQDVSISCKATGLPLPEYLFYKDGSATPVESSGRITADKTSGTIRFHPLKKEDDGKYVCRAYNDVGNVTSTGEITVLVKPSIYDLKHVIMTEGQSISIHCFSHGFPSPVMAFRKAGNKESYVIGDNEDERIFLSNPKPGQLTLNFVSLIPEDASDYICRSKNDIGHDEKTAKLTVNYRPHFPKDHSSSVYIWAGKTRNITCEVQAEPIPQIVWLRRGIEIISNETFLIYPNGRNSSLQVKVTEADQGWIYGPYVCVASNEFGKANRSMELIRATAPNSPKSVNVTECLPTSVIVHVTAPEEDGGDRVKGYVVEYMEKPLNTTSVSVGGAESGDVLPVYNQIPSTVEVQDTDVIEIENLKPNTTYILKVKAKNEVGAGSPKEETVTTQSIRKPYPIEITSDENGDAFRYVITWKKPITGGKPITDYEFKFRQMFSDEETLKDGSKKKHGEWERRTRADDLDRPMLHYDLERLTPSTTYQLEVKAKNELGWSDVVRVFEFRTREATPSEVAMHASVGPGAIVGIVIFIFIILLVAVDVACFFVNRCGVTMCICVHLCGKDQALFNKEKAMEEGESKEVLKQPIETLQPDPSDESAQLPPPAYTEAKEQCLKSNDDEKEKEDLKEVLKEDLTSDEKLKETDNEVKVTSDSKDTEHPVKAAPEV